MRVFLNKALYREGLLAPRPTPKLEDHSSSAALVCLFNLFAATLHIGGRSSISILRTRHDVVTGTDYVISLLNTTGMTNLMITIDYVTLMYNKG